MGDKSYVQLVEEGRLGFVGAKTWGCLGSHSRVLQEVGGGGHVEAFDSRQQNRQVVKSKK